MAQVCNILISELAKREDTTAAWIAEEGLRLMTLSKKERLRVVKEELEWIRDSSTRNRGYDPQSVEYRKEAFYEQLDELYRRGIEGCIAGGEYDPDRQEEAEAAA